MKNLKASIRTALGNSRGYTIADVLIGVIVTGILGFVAIGSLYAVDSGVALGSYFIGVAAVAGVAGLGYYAYTLWKKSTAAGGTKIGQVPGQ